MATKKFSIEAVFKAIDKMSNPLKGMNKNTSKFSRALRTDFAKAQRSVTRFTKNIKRNLGNNLRKVVLGAGVAFAGLGAMFISEASKIENATASFQPLLGSVEKAEQLVSRLNKEAASTPFQFEGIASVAKQLLPVMNGSIEDTAKTFRMLGDTAGGNIQKLETITRGYTKALLKGKPDMEALNMISEAGVPIFAEMSKNMGITTQKLFKLSSSGKLTNKNLTDAFKAMTSEGGVFFNGMEIASQTLTGKFSTLKDNIALTAATVGTVLLPILKPLIDRGIEIAGKMREWATANQEIISEKLTTFLTNFITSMKTIIGVTTTVIRVVTPLAPFILGIASAFAVYTTAVNLAAVATSILNAVMNKNVIGLIITGVGLLIGAIIVLIQNWESVSNWLNSVWTTMKGFAVWIATGFVAAFKTVGKAMLTYWVSPLNLVIEMFQGILKIFGKIPGMGDIATGAIDGLQGFQDKINQNTFFNNEQAPVSPQERANNSTTTSNGELIIRDDTGRAEMTKNPSGSNFKVQLRNSGAL